MGMRCRQLILIMTMLLVFSVVAEAANISTGIYSCDVNGRVVRIEVKTVNGNAISGWYIHTNGKRTAGAQIQGAFNADGVLNFEYQDSWYNQGAGSIRIVDANTLAVTSQETENGPMRNYMIFDGEYTLTKKK